jgi:hypothetical protein
MTSDRNFALLYRSGLCIFGLQWFSEMHCWVFWNTGRICKSCNVFLCAILTCTEWLSECVCVCVCVCLYIIFLNLILSTLHYKGVILHAVSIHLVVQFNCRGGRVQHQALLPLYILSKMGLCTIISNYKYLYIPKHIFTLLQRVKIYRICKG